MARQAKPAALIDTELAELPAAMRWREWMGRAEAIIFASPEPVTRDLIARVVGQSCSIDNLIEDIRHELRERPYELVSVGGGWQLRTRTRFAEAINAVRNQPPTVELTKTEMLVLACIAYHQPATRGDLGKIIGREVSRDIVGRLRSLGFVASGPRSPQPGAPYTYVTTPGFLSHFGLDTLRDLPEMEALRDAGLLGRDDGIDDLIPVLADAVEDVDDGAAAVEIDDAAA